MLVFLDYEYIKILSDDKSESGSIGRFRKTDEEKLSYYEKNCHTATTRKNTKWGLKIFQGTLYLAN